MKNIAVLTSGGDSPGMNAAIRSIVRTANQSNVKVQGIEYGYKGLIKNNFIKLTPNSVGNTIHLGGTLLKSARSKEFYKKEGRKIAYKNIKKNNIDGLIVLGGDGSLTGASIFSDEYNFPIIGIPCTIDNDIYGTDHSLGFATARETIVNAVDKIRDTASSHDRIFIVEVMGRNSGNLALEAGISSGAEMILIPEINLDIDTVINNISKINKKKKSVIIVYAEGCNYGAAYKFANTIENKIKNSNVRYSILGHVQRGGIPVPSDRILGSILGYKAIEILLKGESKKMIGYKNMDYNIISIKDSIRKNKKIDKKLYEIAEIISKQ